MSLREKDTERDRDREGEEDREKERESRKSYQSTVKAVLELHAKYRAHISGYNSGTIASKTTYSKWFLILYS